MPFITWQLNKPKTRPTTTLPELGREQSLQYVSIAYECGWGSILNKLKKPKIYNASSAQGMLFKPYPNFSSCSTAKRARFVICSSGASLYKQRPSPTALAPAFK